MRTLGSTGLTPRSPPKQMVSFILEIKLAFDYPQSNSLPTIQTKPQVTAVLTRTPPEPRWEMSFSKILQSHQNKTKHEETSQIQLSMPRQFRQFGQETGQTLHWSMVPKRQSKFRQKSSEYPVSLWYRRQQICVTTINCQVYEPPHKHICTHIYLHSCR